MKKIYKQLDQEQRYQIGILLTAGKSKKDIADLIGVHKSTITRELQRNIGKRGPHAGRYIPDLAQEKNKFKAQTKKQGSKIHRVA